VLMKSWAFMKWSDTRWVGLTRSSKALCLSLLLGLENYVSFLMKQP
jgi:hypothetical protein